MDEAAAAAVGAKSALFLAASQSAVAERVRLYYAAAATVEAVEAAVEAARTPEPRPLIAIAARLSLPSASSSSPSSLHIRWASTFGRPLDLV